MPLAFVLTGLGSRGVRNHCQAVNCSRDSDKETGAKGHEAQFIGSYYVKHYDGLLTPLLVVGSPEIHLL